MHPAEELLTALGHDITTFQTFPEAPNAKGPPTILHGPHRVQAKRLTRLNEQGHGIFFMVNHGDNQGRRAENVKSVAAHFVDLDGTPLYDHWPLEPTAIIESSPGRYHAYWRVKNAPLDAFTHTQKHVATLLAGDDKCVDLPRVLRLPGYQHQKGEPFTTRIVEITYAVHTHEAFQAHFGVPPLPPARKPPAPEVLAYIQRYKKPARGGHPATPTRTLDSAVEKVATAQEGNRNHTLYRTACGVVSDIRAGTIDRQEAEYQLALAAETAGLDPREAQATIRSAMRHI